MSKDKINDYTVLIWTLVSVVHFIAAFLDSDSDHFFFALFSMIVASIIGRLGALEKAAGLYEEDNRSR